MPDQTEFLVKYPVRAILDLPTSHLRPATHEWLNAVLERPEHERLLSSSARTSFGWLVHVPAAPFIIGIIPDDLEDVLRYARERKCEYVLFDRDASPHPSVPLPVYDENKDEEPGKMRNWRVRLSSTVTDVLTTYVTVQATSEDGAIEAALDREAYKNAVWEVTHCGTREDVQAEDEPECLGVAQSNEETGD